MIQLESYDPRRNRARRYAMHLQPNLFGGIDLVCEWGRVGHTGGAQRCRTFATEHEAMREIRRIVRRKERRGYVLTGGNEPLQIKAQFRIHSADDSG